MVNEQLLANKRTSSIVPTMYVARRPPSDPYGLRRKIRFRFPYRDAEYLLSADDTHLCFRASKLESQLAATHCPRHRDAWAGI